MWHLWHQDQDSVCALVCAIVNICGPVQPCMQQLGAAYVGTGSSTRIVEVCEVCQRRPDIMTESAAWAIAGCMDTAAILILLISEHATLHCLATPRAELPFPPMGHSMLPLFHFCILHLPR